MSTLIDIDACLARLVAQNPASFFKVVDTAYEMNPLEDSGDMPAVFIYPGYIDANPVGDGATKQKVNNTLVVDIVCKVTDLETAVGHTRDIFLGWEMDDQHSPITLAATGYQQNQACGPMDIRGGVIHWQERYQNSTWTKRIHN